MQLTASRRDTGASLDYLCFAARRGRSPCLPCLKAATGAIWMGRHRGLPLHPEGGHAVHAAHMVHPCPQRPLGPPSASRAGADERKKPPSLPEK